VTFALTEEQMLALGETASLLAVSGFSLLAGTRARLYKFYFLVSVNITTVYASKFVEFGEVRTADNMISIPQG
jgi:hypothetical protein